MTDDTNTTDTTVDDAPSLTTSIANFFLVLAGIMNLLMGTWYSWQEKPELTATCLAGGLLLLLAGTVERFKSIQGLGIKAETRDLKKAIAKAGASLAQLRTLAEFSCASMVSFNSATGRWDSAPTLREATEAAEKARGVLAGMGSTKPTIHKTLEPWVATTIRDQVARLLVPIRTHLTQQQAVNNGHSIGVDSTNPAYPGLKAAADQLATLHTEIENYNKWPLGTESAQLSDIVKKIPGITKADRETLNAEISPWIRRFKHLVASYELPDPEAWYEADERT